MNYELAKKLKEAGFLQGTDNKSDNCGIHWYRDMNDITNPKTEVYFPNLSELIEACGDSFIGLTKHKNDWNKWCAVGYNGKSRFEQWAETSEEAIANLWLIMKK